MCCKSQVYMKNGGEYMDNDEELDNIAAELRREKAKLWRKNNKEKVKEIHKRYWRKKAKEELEKRENQKKEGE